MPNYGLLAALANLLIAAVNFIIVKHLTVKLGRHRFIVLMLGAGTIPLIIFTAIAVNAPLSAYPMLLSIAAGIFLGLGYILFYKSMESQQVSNLSILSQLTLLILLLFGLFVLGERISALSALGALGIFTGSLIMLVNKHLRINRLMLPALFGTICWAASWIMLTYASSATATFSQQLLFSRSAGFAVVLLYLFSSPRQERKTVRLKGAHLFAIIALSLLSGFLDAGTNIAYSFVIKAKFVAIGSAIVAVLPVITTLIARLVYKDRLTRFQLLGLATSVMGAITVNVR